MCHSTVALFIKAKDPKQLKCPFIGQLSNKDSISQYMEYYAAIKKSTGIYGME